MEGKGSRAALAWLSQGADEGRTVWWHDTMNLPTATEPSSHRAGLKPTQWAPEPVRLAAFLVNDEHAIFFNIKTTQ